MTSSNSKQNEAFVLLGKVTKVHGLRGELKVLPFTENPANFSRYQCLYLAAEDGQEKITYTNIQARVTGKMVILRLRECLDRDRAEQLVGQHIWLAAHDLPPLAETEFYLHSLESKVARTVSGSIIGTVIGFLGGVQDMLIIRDGSREYLVPVVRQFIVALDEVELVLDLPPGLLEVND